MDRPGDPDPTPPPSDRPVEDQPFSERATWVAPVEADDVPDRHRPVHQLAGSFSVDGTVAGATLHVTAHGIYEAFLNGARVGDRELTPGWTAYRSRLAVQSYDVTGLLTPGTNHLGALLSDGWWRGQNSVARRVDDYGPTTALLAQLTWTCTDGTTGMFGTDASWRSTPSHILAADLIVGEVHDQRRRRGFDDTAGWAPVRVEDHGHDRLVTDIAPPIRRVEELAPVSVTRLAPRRWVVDFGQNISGWVRLDRLGPTGTEVTLTYGEWLDADGDVTQDHLQKNDISTFLDVAFQTDRVIADGSGTGFEPRHSTKGFQYVRVEATPGDGTDGPGLDDLGPDDLVAVVVHSDLPRIGAFACSDDRLNTLHAMADWSFRGNVCGLPTDCPTRERAGWTGDWQVFVETAAGLYDVADLNRSWLRDLAAEQRSDGTVTNLVPESHPGDDRPPTYWPFTEGSSGWGDAAVHVPWVQYRMTGDTGIVAEAYPAAKRWVDRAARVAATDRHADRIARSAEPAPHETYLWDTGWHFGEWLEGGETLDDAISKVLLTDPGPVATAYLHRSARELADLAGVLGLDDDATHYRTLAGRVADAWRIEFLAADGTVTPDTQAGATRALAFGLVPPELTAAVADRLVQAVRAADDHLTTGLLSTVFLLPVLADHGHAEVAWDVLLQTSEPSWLVMLERGATTMWEEWGGVDADGVAHASLNHYGKGAFVFFLHRYLAGLAPLEPGFRRFRVAPRPGGGVTWARLHHDAPAGRIEVHWERDGESTTVQVTVPEGTTAEIVPPGGEPTEVGPGRHVVTG